MIIQAGGNKIHIGWVPEPPWQWGRIAHGTGFFGVMICSSDVTQAYKYAKTTYKG